MGIRFRLFPPKVSYKEGAFTVVADDGSKIFYLEGDSPEEHRYTGPVKTEKPHLRGVEPHPDPAGRKNDRN